MGTEHINSVLSKADIYIQAIYTQRFAQSIRRRIIILVMGIYLAFSVFLFSG